MAENQDGGGQPDGDTARSEGDDHKVTKADSRISRSVSIDSDETVTGKKDLDDVVEVESVSETRLGEWKYMRRIIAEDPEWSLATVPLLKELVVNHIAENFENNSAILNKLLEKFQKRVLARISTKLPLKVTAVLVDDEGFWERCCRARWEVCDISYYGNNWKRMYMEKNLEQIIELFVPNTTNPELLEETLKLTGHFIKKLNIGQLLPPVKVARQRPDFDEVSESGEADEEQPCDHFNFASVLPQLPNLEELHLCYGVRDCGMNFEWNLFQFTTRDCLQLAQSVAAYKGLRVLRVHRSKMDDDKARVLISQIINHPGLQELDLSNNIISDRGARAIAKFVKNNSVLTKLNLCDNQIRMVGAQALGHALARNRKLEYLNLRLNRLGDEGGQAVCKAVLTNRSIVDLNLGSNDLAEPSAAILSQVLVKNDIIRRIDLSCNRLGPDGGKQLQEGMEENKTIIHLDLRLTECGQEAEYCISKILNHNQEVDRLQRIKNNEAINAQYYKTVFEPQASHRYKLPPTAIIA